MKNLKHFLLLAVLLCIGLGAKAHDFKVGNVYYEIISSQDQTVRVVWTWINKTSSVAKERYRYEDQTEINIPNNVTYNGKTYAVIEIQQDAFNGTNSKIMSVTLHANLKTIGSNAFKGLTKLKSITIPTNVASIGSGAFDGCTGLDTVTWKAKTVTDVFKGSNIKVLIINDSVETLVHSSFANCTKLKTVTLGKNVVNLGEPGYNQTGRSPFYQTDSIETLYYNTKNVTIYNAAFQSKKKLKTVIIGDSVETLPDGFLMNCTALTAVNIPPLLKIIPYQAFYGCKQLKEMEAQLPDSIDTIGGQAFYECESLSSIKFNDSLKYISYEAFKGCKGLTEIVIPDSVNTLAHSAFSNCDNLKAVTLGISVANLGEPGYNQTGRSPFYQTDNIETLYYNIKHITNGTDVFKSRTKLKKVVFGDSVEYLPEGFLSGCSGLTEANIPVLLTGVPKQTFYNCNSLPSIEIPTGIKTIGTEAFAYCKSLTEITIPDSVETLMHSSFANCTKLKTVTLGKNVVNLGEPGYTPYDQSPFYNTDSIETLYYNTKNVTIYNAAFQSKKKLKTVVIGDSVETLPSNFISGCTAIDSIISHAKVAPTAQSNSFSQVKKDIPVMVPCGSQDSYKSANYWKEFTNIQTKTYDTSVTMSLCYGETFNSRTAMQSGVFVDTLQSTDGCDSIVTINLTVFPIYDTAIYVTTIVDEKGEDYYDTIINNLQTINGCDSVVTTITFYDYDNSIDTIYNNLTAAICQGETYSFNNNELNASGTYTHTVNVNKYRDSIITLTLTVNPIYDTTISATICKGQTYSNNGFNTNEAGMHTLNLTTINGCDSTVTLNLSVVDGYDTTITAEICSSESFGENSYGIYIKNLVSSDGCDSVVRVNLVAKQYTGDVDTVHIHDTVTVTQIDTVTLHDTITNEITKFDTVTLHDTIETTLYDTVTLFDTIETTLYDTVTLHDTIETTLYDTVTLHDTIETILYDTVTLFDTIETTLYDTVTLHDTIETTLYDTVTLFDTIETTLYDTVTLFDTITNEVTLYDTVTLTDTVTVTLYDTINTTDTIVLTQTDTVTLTDTITVTLFDTVNTIDTVYLHDTITPCGVTRTYIYAEINAGETYNGYGFTESDAGEYTLNLQTEDGCDSIVTLILQVTAGIEEIQAERVISIYPNPAHDRVTIHADGDIKIIDNKGQVVREIKNVNGVKDINVSDFEAGVYYINVGKHTQPLIIE